MATKGLIERERACNSQLLISLHLQGIYVFDHPLIETLSAGLKDVV